MTVSEPLTAASETNLKSKLKTLLQRDIRLVTKVDTSILGGLIVRVGDTVYDGSVDGQLKVLRKAAASNAEASIRKLSATLIGS